MIKEFKEFISRGSVVDLAVGVIMGSAFGKIVSSLVNDIMMPFIGVILGGINFSGLTLNVGAAVINYGMFIQNIIDFLIISICIFVFIKFINRLSKPKKTPAKEEVKVEVKKADDVLLLEEIRDLLKLQNKKAKTNPKK